MIRAAYVIVAAAGIGLAGCAAGPKPLYHWEGYQRQVYESFKGDGTGPAEQLGVMQIQAEKARAAGAALPPGFRAHIALLQLRMGRYDEARRMIEEEKAVFPESAHYMDFVLKSMGEKSDKKS
jgi:hypothetical protein